MKPKPTDYSHLDHPKISNFLFYPRPEPPGTVSSADLKYIPVEEHIKIGACFHIVGPDAPTILFFHGNGEIVSDYNDLAQIYNQMGINFFPVDYRGYGNSNGNPSVSTMMQDCHVIFQFIKRWLKDHQFNDNLIVMGRSLGSASALELGHFYQDQMDAIIIESGFANDLALLELLGVDSLSLGLSKKKGIGNADKIQTFVKPALIIHAEHDHIIPFSDGQMLYDLCPSAHKFFVKIPLANHNTIFQVGLELYFKEIESFLHHLNQIR